MPHYHICTVRPPGYAHSDCFREIAEGLLSALHSLGHTVASGENTLDPKATNILLGAHLLSEEKAMGLPADAIVYNLEQLSGASLPGWYLSLAARVRIWDYSELNLRSWAQVPCREPVKLVEIGYVPQLCRIPKAPVQDIDVLFYGSENERRKAVLDRLTAAGLRVHHAFGVYGAERDDLVARAKLVLNVHYYETQVFEIVRVSYLLANGKAVVTESSPNLGGLRDAVALAHYEELVDTCVRLIQDEDARKALEARAHTIFAGRDQAALLRDALSSGAPAEAAFPRRLNLGSGKDWRADCLNIDINDYWHPDAVLDISQPLPPVFALETERFGTIEIGANYFDEILANDVLEHIPNLMAAMTEALRLLRPGGIFNIHVPYDLSCGAWQDPTHVRAFNERSWLYYTEWFWYMGWTEARFTVHKLEFVLSPLGEKLKASLQGEDLIRTPRAVDSMRVHLRKQMLDHAELNSVTQYLRRPERVQHLSSSSSRDLQDTRRETGVGAAAL